MQGIIGIIILGIFSYLFWLFIKKTLFRTSPAAQYIYDQEVVGEASYQENLRTIVGNTKDEVHIHGLNAQLTHEPDNAYDRNAVKVEINGLLVGYLPRQAAKKHVNAGKGALQCPALIAGGGKEKPNFGVWLAYKQTPTQ